MMNILFVNMTPFYGGGEVYLKSLINYVDNETEGKYAFVVSPYVEQFNSQLTLRKDRIFTISYKYKCFISTVKKIRNIIDKNNIDLIVLNGNRSLYLSPFFNNVDKVAIKHTTLNANKGIKRIFSNYMMKICFSFIDKLIVISNYHKIELIVNNMCNAEKIIVIYNGVDVRYFKKRSVLKNDFLTITTVARIEKEKGIFDLIEAFEQLYYEYNNIKLVIVGDGSEINDLTNEVDRRNLKQAVQILGFRKDVKNILDYTDIFVLPSYSEGLPLSLLEAMSMGIPVIATNVGGIPEVITDKKEGFLIEPGDILKLKECLSTLILDESTRDYMGKKSEEKVNIMFNIDVMLNNIENVLFKYKD